MKGLGVPAGEMDKYFYFSAPGQQMKGRTGQNRQSPSYQPRTGSCPVMLYRLWIDFSINKKRRGPHPGTLLKPSQRTKSGKA